MERRAQARGVQQLREARAVPIEVAAQQSADPADGGVTTVLVEQLPRERAEAAAIAQERLQRARQATVDVPEVLTQQLIHLGRDAVVEGLRALHERLELTAHEVGVQRRAGSLEGDEADAQGARDQRGALLFRVVAQECGQASVDERELLDDDAVRAQAHAFSPRGDLRQRDDRGAGGGVHARQMCGAAVPACLSRSLPLSRCISSSPTEPRERPPRCAHTLKAWSSVAWRRRPSTCPCAWRKPSCPSIGSAPRRSGPPPTLVIGGQSYGGRVASLLAAADGGIRAGSSASATRCIDQGEPEWEPRSAHWPDLSLPGTPPVGGGRPVRPPRPPAPRRRRAAARTPAW